MSDPSTLRPVQGGAGSFDPSTGSDHYGLRTASKQRARRILIVNQYYPPDTSATAKIVQTVAEALAERHQVTVLAGRPSYDPTERHRWRLLRREQQGKVTVERVGSTAYQRQRMRLRLANYLSYLALAVPRALTARCDLVLAMTDPPMAGIAGAVVARLRRKPFVYNIRDLHPDMTVAAGVVRRSRWLDTWERLHRWALRQADLVIVLGEDMRQRIIAKGVDPGRVEVVRDGVPIPETLASPQHPAVQEMRCGFPFVVLHAGNLGFYGAWETLVRAAKLLDNDDVGFVFVGNGAAKAEVEALAAPCPQVRFLPFRPAEEVPYVLAAGDIHVVTVRRGLEGMVVPSKLYPILAAGRPVLAVAPGASDVARIVSQGGCGLVADPDDPASVAAAIRSLIKDPGRLEQLGWQARAIAPEYERSRHLERLVHLVEQVRVAS